MVKLFRVSVPLGAALLIMAAGLCLVDASAASIQPDPGVEGLLVTRWKMNVRDGDCSCAASKPY
jgi:hypothetical protein